MCDNLQPVIRSRGKSWTPKFRSLWVNHMGSMICENLWDLLGLGLRLMQNLFEIKVIQERQAHNWEIE